MTPPVLASLESGILSITLNRPAKRNALSSEMVELLHQSLEQADLDGEVRVVLIRGAGKDFCAGADLDELLASADRTVDENEAAALRLGQIFERIRLLPKPVVSLVQGRALAGGAGLATACDLPIAGTGAQLGYPEIQRGFVPAMVATLLRRLAGEKTSLDLILTGRVLGAEEARIAGLVARVVPDVDLEREGTVVAQQLAGSSGSALALTKRLFFELEGKGFSEGIRLGARVNAVSRGTPDFREAVARFLQQ
ncbi:MAG: enoyl-CoA hydratase/isomerase family protein [Gemmatimonadales bacterium]|nr:enoyl-CoA hydratase/isomerase family protein [Gemmatimonadales bacterium]